jgi:virginiamycin B lyase
MRYTLLFTAAAGVTALVIYAGSDSSSSLRAQSGIALTGLVISEEEDRMQGVVVTARREGSPISVSVVTDESGRYNFPESKLPDGDYLLKVRAIGYELVGPGGVDVRSGVTANAIIKLRQTKDLAAQLTNAEWLASMPGSDEQ